MNDTCASSIQKLKLKWIGGSVCDAVVIFGVDVADDRPTSTQDLFTEEDEAAIRSDGPAEGEQVSRLSGPSESGDWLGFGGAIAFTAI